ncbi:F-box-like domain-containing protein [Legionella tunisiensis]|uniref:F-box-like domain-containing protein n=1 Tax=Legionella tunisiensis TaxID=1034944 RepID=UPI00037EA071|nr:F-box-like domain-containing protein [Legionella tunisiensis]
MPLPEEITLTLFDWLPRRDIFSTFSVCKDWQRISLSAKTWKEAGASSYEDFKKESKNYIQNLGILFSMRELVCGLQNVSIKYGRYLKRSARN